MASNFAGDDEGVAPAPARARRWVGRGRGFGTMHN
jgi:hypothetical protein